MGKHEHSSVQKTLGGVIFRDRMGVFYDTQNTQNSQSVFGNMIILLVLCKQNSAYNV